ncbi:MAG: hypothetical protein J3R72DRAFT_457794 [Linnemannia gamsii]|nr:MAG: hypothetical protein J3R72DRAFT_457794 [Linnemannia gamsii]
MRYVCSWLPGFGFVLAPTCYEGSSHMTDATNCSRPKLMRPQFLGIQVLFKASTYKELRTCNHADICEELLARNHSVNNFALFPHCSFAFDIPFLAFTFVPCLVPTMVQTYSHRFWSSGS